MNILLLILFLISQIQVYRLTYQIKNIKHRVKLLDYSMFNNVYFPNAKSNYNDD